MTKATAWDNLMCSFPPLSSLGVIVERAGVGQLIGVGSTRYNVRTNRQLNSTKSYERGWRTQAETVPSSRTHLPKVLSTVSLMAEICMSIESVSCKTQGRGGDQEKHGSRGGEGAGEGFVYMDPKRANVTRRG